MAKVLLLGSLSRSLLEFRGHLIRRLLDDGHRVLAVAPDLGDEVASTLDEWGARWASIPMSRRSLNPARDLHTLWALHRLFAKEQPDIFVGYTIKPVVYGLLAAWLADIPSRYALITGLGTTFTDVQSKKQYLLQTVASMLYRVSLSTSHCAIFQNRDDAYLFCARRLVGGPEQVALINGSGVDLQHYTPAPQPDDTSFLMIARLLKNKGVLEYVEAARRVKTQHPDVSFRLVGGCDAGPSAIDPDTVQSWTQGDIIDYRGYVDDVRPIVADSSVFVLPSYREGTPRTVLEAMAMARPIVTTDVAGCRQTVIPGDNGFLVEPRDAGSLARAMTHFIGEPELVRAMGTRSRYIAESKFDVDQVTDSLLAALALSPRRVPPPLPSQLKAR